MGKEGKRWGSQPDASEKLIGLRMREEALGDAHWSGDKFRLFVNQVLTRISPQFFSIVEEAQVRVSVSQSPVPFQVEILSHQKSGDCLRHYKCRAFSSHPQGESKQTKTSQLWAIFHLVRETSCPAPDGSSLSSPQSCGNQTGRLGVHPTTGVSEHFQRIFFYLLLLPLRSLHFRKAL